MEKKSFSESMKRRTNLYNQLSFEEGDRKRKLLLEKVPDSFTPKQAAEAWCMKIPNVNAMTQKMRKYGMIISSGGHCSRIFHKVKE